MMLNNDFASAIPCVQFVVKNEKEDSSLVVSAQERLATCYTMLKRYNEALATVEALKEYYPAYPLYVERKGEILNQMGIYKETDARRSFVACLLRSTTPA